MTSMRYTFALGAASAVLAVPGPGFAAELGVKLEIPRLTVAEYHKPYVAIWIEKPDQAFAGNLAVWYEVDNDKQEGTKWLKDMRAWWRKSGRDLAMPVDGLSGATRAPGTHSVNFAATKAPLKDLPAGSYQLVVEAAREVGGRELLRVPFTWPPAAPVAASAKGAHELGAVSVELKP